MNEAEFKLSKIGYHQIGEKLFSQIPMHVPFIVDCKSETDTLFAHTGIVCPNELIVERVMNKILEAIPCDHNYNEKFVLSIEAREEFSTRQEAIEYMENLQTLLQGRSIGQISTSLLAGTQEREIYHSVVSGSCRMGNIIDHIMAFYLAKSAA
jgi:hypothetical protein